MTMIQLSWQDSQRGDFFQNGSKYPLSTSLRVTQWQLRVGHSVQIGERPGFVYADLPMSSIEPGGALSGQARSSGPGDLTMMFALWPYADHERQTYVAVGAYLLLPTGEYRAQRWFNPGANRYSGALQVGFQTALSDHWRWMAALDGAAFGANTDYGSQHARKDQRVMYTAQTGVEYHFDPRHGFAVNAIQTWGGETRIGGVDQNDAQLVSRYLLTVFKDTAVGRFSVQYGGDLKTRNGYFEDYRWALRYLVLF